jgi:hypothetical protein
VDGSLSAAAISSVLADLSALSDSDADSEQDQADSDAGSDRSDREDKPSLGRFDEDGDAEEDDLSMGLDSIFESSGASSEEER